MPKLTPQQKRDNAIQRTYERYQCLTKGKVKNDVLKTFQELRRLECADYVNGQLVLQCISSGEWQDFENFDAGHYISRRHTATAFSRDNVWPQLKFQNQHLNGNLADYRKGLIRRIGEERVLQLEYWADVKVEISTWTYAQMKECFRAQVKQEKERLGL